MKKFVLLLAVLGGIVGTTIAVGCGASDPVVDATSTPDAGTSGSDGAVPVPPRAAHAVGGTVKGLEGTGLVLQNNQGDDLVVKADGKFSFSKQVTEGAAYAVTVKTQPMSPPQTCTVDKGGGTMASADVTDVAVTCKTEAFRVGGTVAGLAAGNEVVLQNKGGNDLKLNANGPFAFAGFDKPGTTYAVSVLTNPTTPNQTCTVTGESGSIVAGHVTSVVVNCTTNKYTVGGTVSGLDGKDLVLQNNGGGDVTVNANGAFAFMPQDDGSDYEITVKQQPTMKSQTCAVTMGKAKVAGANVTSVAVACTTNKYTVGGTIKDLTAAGLVLQNNAGDDLAVNNGATTFTFVTPIESGATYDVKVKTHPTGLGCFVSTGSGTVTNANVTSVAVTCKPLTLVGSTQGVDFFKVAVTGTMTDANIFAACAAEGLTVPCSGQAGCFYNDAKCKITPVETECGNPMQKLSQSICAGGDPDVCPALKGVYQYMGENWLGGCGVEATWCAIGNNNSNKSALCVFP